MTRSRPLPTFTVEQDGKGNHRIVRRQGPSTIQGEWASYMHVAELKVGFAVYIAVTEYYAGTAMKPGAVYRLWEEG
jgi:hypothetical protein